MGPWVCTWTQGPHFWDSHVSMRLDQLQGFIMFPPKSHKTPPCAPCIQTLATSNACIVVELLLSPLPPHPPLPPSLPSPPSPPLPPLLLFPPSPSSSPCVHSDATLASYKAMYAQVLRLPDSYDLPNNTLLHTLRETLESVSAVQHQS